MVRPIRVAATRLLPYTPAQIMDEFLRVERWSTFRGYGPVPGIREARFLHRAEGGGEVGTRIAVTNRDGSTHREEIVEWAPRASGPSRIAVRIDGFSPPLARLALRFIEEWDLVPDAASGGTRTTRAFTLEPTNALARIPLLAIGWLLARALARHLAEFGPGGPVADTPR